MFSKKQYTVALAALLIALLFSTGMLTRGARAQQPQQTQTPLTTQQDRTRPRRTVDSPRTTTPPQQPESSGDDTTLQDDDDVVRVETDLTNILFTAVDKQKRFITTLKSEDVRILEDGQPQEIFAFQRQTDLPLSLAILIDTSISEERTLPAEKSAASAFVDAVMRTAKDAIYTTTDEELSHTSDKTRRAIILLTDGVDSSSRIKMSEAIDRAIKADTVIYCIGIGDELFGGVDQGSLKKLSERTGGRAFFPRDESDLRAAFGQIQEELRSQYLVAYSPTNKNRDGSYRRVQIEILNPELRKNLRLTYRQGYFAKTPGGK